MDTWVILRINLADVHTVSPNFQPGMTHQFSLDIQAEPHEGWVLETGYVGSRGTHLSRIRSLNQALSAFPNNPIREATTNTLTNLTSRVPILGILPDSVGQLALRLQF